MLRAEQIAWIRRLAGDGVSQRAIVRATGVHRKTVAELLEMDREESELKDTIYDVEDPVFTEAPSRCEGCGATVYKPCLACGLREA